MNDTDQVKAATKDVKSNLKRFDLFEYDTMVEHVVLAIEDGKITVDEAVQEVRDQFA